MKTEIMLYFSVPTEHFLRLFRIESHRKLLSHALNYNLIKNPKDF